jgi:hypothetical protein
MKPAQSISEHTQILSHDELSLIAAAVQRHQREQAAEADSSTPTNTQLRRQKLLRAAAKRRAMRLQAPETLRLLENPLLLSSGKQLGALKNQEYTNTDKGSTAEHVHTKWLGEQQRRKT